MTRIADIMTRAVEVIQRDDTIGHAVQRMRALDVGALPVCDGNAFVGIVRPRHRHTRRGDRHDPAGGARFRRDATAEVRWCTEGETVEQVPAQMGDEQARRLAVLNEPREIVGIVALGDLATRQPAHTDEALREISTPD